MKNTTVQALVAAAILILCYAGLVGYSYASRKQASGQVSPPGQTANQPSTTQTTPEANSNPPPTTQVTNPPQAPAPSTTAPSVQHSVTAPGGDDEGFDN